MHEAMVFSTGFRQIFTAWFVLNCWLREFPLSTIANHFELQCQSKATRFIVLQILSMLAMVGCESGHEFTAKE